MIRPDKTIEVYTIQECDDEMHHVSIFQNAILIVWVILTCRCKTKHLTLGHILQFSSAVVGCILSIRGFVKFDQWSHKQTNVQSKCMTEQTEEQTEGDQSGVLITSLITLMSYCVYMHTETGLTWVELFMDVNTHLTCFLYTSQYFHHGNRPHAGPENQWQTG